MEQSSLGGVAYLSPPLLLNARRKARSLFEAVLAVAVFIDGFLNGVRCGNATEVTGYLYPGRNRTAIIITRIYSVVDAAGSEVAWVYLGNTGERVTEASPFLKARDAKTMGLPVDIRNRPGYLAPYRSFDRRRFQTKLCADGKRFQK